MGYLFAQNQEIVLNDKELEDAKMKHKTNFDEGSGLRDSQKSFSPKPLL